MGLNHFLRTFCELLYIAGVGVNPGKQTVYHMCKTWLKKVQWWEGTIQGGDF